MSEFEFQNPAYKWNDFRLTPKYAAVIDSFGSKHMYGNADYGILIQDVVKMSIEGGVLIYPDADDRLNGTMHRYPVAISSFRTLSLSRYSKYTYNKHKGVYRVDVSNALRVLLDLPITPTMISVHSYYITVEYRNQKVNPHLSDEDKTELSQAYNEKVHSMLDQFKEHVDSQINKKKSKKSKQYSGKSKELNKIRLVHSKEVSKLEDDN